MTRINSTELLKEFRAQNKMNLPRAVCMLLLFCMIMIFASSIMNGIALSLFTVFAGNSSTLLIGLLIFFALELYLLYFFFILQYGLFLCSLRLVRKQIVALSFLFVGRKQWRAKKFALFFVPSAILILIFSMWPFYSLQEFSDPKVLLEYFTENPEAPRKVLLSTAIFLTGSFIFYFPFTFAWPVVYDTTEGGFRKMIFSALTFFKGRLFNFIFFELKCLYPYVLVFAAANVLEFFILKYFPENTAFQLVFSALGFVSFISVMLLCAVFILSVNFYYSRFHENPEQENSN